MYFVAVTSDQWVNMLTPLFVAIAIVLQMRRDNAAKEERKEVKEKVDEVKVDLKDNTTKTEKIHKQLNGERSVLLHTIARQARQIAELSQRPEDEALAKAAARVASDHDAAQVTAK